MRTKIQVFTKAEAHPVGEVFGLISIWKKGSEILAESFLARQNDQGKPIVRRLRIDKAMRKSVDLWGIIEADMKRSHRESFLRPAQEEFYRTARADTFFPYAEERFPWQELESGKLYIFIDWFPELLPAIHKSTQCPKLRDLLGLYLRFHAAARGS